MNSIVSVSIGGIVRFFKWLMAELRYLNLKFRIRHIHGPEKIDYSVEELIVLTVVRNGELYVKTFIEHYISMGAKHIVFLDNDSTDLTLNIAKGYPNVTILQTSCRYRKYETVMKQYLVKRFSANRWNLFVDIDELFDYPFSAFLSLSDLLQYLNLHSYTAVLSQMLDLLPDQSLAHLSKDYNQDLKGNFPHYDISNIMKSDYIWGSLSNTAIKMHWAGIRDALFGTYNGLTKAALTFMDSKMEVFVDFHHIRNGWIADFSTVLYHYPFAGSFYEKVREAVSTNRYGVSAGHQYEKYWERISEEPDLKIPLENTCVLQSVEDLVENEFLVVSFALKNYVSIKRPHVEGRSVEDGTRSMYSKPQV